MYDPLYFIALLPDPVIQKEVTGFKQECARLFGASHALKSPPHLTLLPPFPWHPADLQKLGKALGAFAASQKPFEVALENFSCFPPRVIFVNVATNPSLHRLCEALQTQLEQTLGLKNKRGRGFNPHMTIAHRDLRQDTFPEAWAHFSKIIYRRTFKADRLALLEHTKQRWEVYEEYFFESLP